VISNVEFEKQGVKTCSMWTRRRRISAFLMELKVPSKSMYFTGSNITSYINISVFI
jgi:hypothetical protein